MHDSLKIWRKNNSRKMSHSPSEYSHFKKASNLINICPTATARSLLQSVLQGAWYQMQFYTQFQIPHSPPYRLILNFISFINEIFFSEFTPRCHTLGSGSMDFNNWKKISTITLAINHSSCNMVCTWSKHIQCRTVREEKSLYFCNIFR